MKKILLLGTIILALLGCSKSDNKTYNVVESTRYSQIKEYLYVEWEFQDDLRCKILWNEIIGEQLTGKTKTWLVYLTGFYYYGNDTYKTSIFYECYKANTTYCDYYLVVR